MDLSFGRLQSQASPPLPLDYPRLIAILASVQGASRTAQRAARLEREDLARAPAGGLVALLGPDSDWMAAAASLDGSFNPGAIRCQE